MMNYIWAGFILAAILIGCCTGQIADVSHSVLTYAGKAVQISLSLIGIMALWLGVMKIAEASGLTCIFAKLIRPLIRFLFPDLKKNATAKKEISMNMIANILGLGNAATPLGIKAMQTMQKDNTKKDTLSNSMMMFIVINTASIQLIPTNVIAIRSSLNSQNPTSIILPVWIATIVAAVVGISLTKILIKKVK